MLTAKVFEHLQNQDPQDICVSSITYAELTYGVEKSQMVEKNRLALALMLSNIEIIAFDMEAAECYGKIRAELESQSNQIGALDMLIASIAKAHNYTLVTNNVKEFSRIKGLKIENWAE